MRGPDRRGCALLGPGRELPVGTGARPTPTPGGDHVDARAGGGDPLGRARESAVRCPALGPVAQLPLHDPQPVRAGSVPRPFHVVGPGVTRPPGAALGGRSLRRGARLRVVLPQGPTGVFDHAPGVRVEMGRRGRGRAAVRDPRQRVLLADGAFDRRNPRGSRARQAPARRDDGHTPGRRSRTRPDSSLRREACACGRSVTSRPTRRALSSSPAGSRAATAARSRPGSTGRSGSRGSRPPIGLCRSGRSSPRNRKHRRHTR